MDRGGHERLEALLADFAERRDAGESLDAEAFAAEHPEGGDALRRALAELQATEELFPDAADDLPAQVGPYRVLGEIGRGGMGRILRVEHRDRPGEALALKLLHVGLEGSARALERFRREGQALERLQHPGVVEVVETGLAHGRPYLVMPLVEGSNLAELVAVARRCRDAAGTEAGVAGGDHLALPGEGTPAELAARIVARAARAVAAAHAAGVLHRDLGPRNVLLRPDGEPVVIDFGLVRSEDTPTLTASGDMLGTPQYMSPEQARGERVDARSDVYGLGTILFELLTLEPPRAAGDTLSVLRAAGSRPVPSPRRLDPGVPPALATITRRALAHRPAWRYATAADLAADLEAWLAGEPIAARPPGPLERAHTAWQLHRGAVSAGLALLVIAAVVLAWPGRDPAHVAMLAREAQHRATAAWFDGRLDDMAGHVAELADLAPDDRVLGHLAALAAGRLPDGAGAASVAGDSAVASGAGGTGGAGDGGAPGDGVDAGLAALAAGERLRREGRAGEALLQFEMANNVMPNTPIVLASLAVAAREAGRVERALELHEFLARFIGEALALHVALAEMYLEVGRFDDAVLASGTALRLAPDDPAVQALAERCLAARAAGHDVGVADGAADGADG